jgi:hypothetical protein
LGGRESSEGDRHRGAEQSAFEVGDGSALAHVIHSNSPANKLIDDFDIAYDSLSFAA